MDFQTPPQSIVCFEQGGKGHVITGCRPLFTAVSVGYKQSGIKEKSKGARSLV